MDGDGKRQQAGVDLGQSARGAGHSQSEFPFQLPGLELDVSGGGVRLHPKGRQIVFMKGAGRRDLWVIENFLPKGK